MKIFKTNEVFHRPNWAITLDNGETLYGARSKEELEKLMIVHEHLPFIKRIYDY